MFGEAFSAFMSKLERRRLRRRRIHAEAELLAELGTVIVEMREHPGLSPVLNNVCSTLPGVPLQLFHGLANGAFARAAVPSSCKDTRFLQVNADNLDHGTYSMLLTSQAFWGHVAKPRVLIFQSDSGICQTHTLAPLVEAARYDYCGAAWPSPVGGLEGVGNGGFSVRSRAAALSMLRIMTKKDTRNEDLAFNSACRRNTTCTLCPREVALRFSYEHGPFPSAWGFHIGIEPGQRDNCTLHARIRLLGQRAPSVGGVPDSATWVPKVTAETM